MNKHFWGLSVGMLAAALTGVAQASSTNHEFSDGVIVVSDNWCAPDNDGYCNTCNNNRLIQGSRCTNSYCDNMNLQCANPPVVNNGQTFLDGPRFIVNETDPGSNYGWTSDENGANSLFAVCPFGYAMVGAYSSGNYSDNVRTVCQHVNRVGGWTGITITRFRASTPISDEAPNNQITTGNWLSGASCTGNFCDNMYYYYNVISW